MLNCVNLYYLQILSCLFNRNAIEIIANLQIIIRNPT